MPTYKFRVNGSDKTVESWDPNEPLLYVLRGELGLSGPKFGCGLGQCGACSVLSDDGARRSCVRPVSAFEGQNVTTVEGLPALWAKDQGIADVDPEVDLHPIQQAWIEE